jgi:hypothetical protein
MSKEYKKIRLEKLRSEALQHYEKAAQSLGESMVVVSIAINNHFDELIQKLRR